MKIIIDIKEVNLSQDPRLLIPYMEEKKRFGTDVMMTGLLDKKGEIVLEAAYDYIFGESIEQDDIIILGRITGINDKMPYSFDHPFVRCNFTAFNANKGIIHEGFDMFTLSTDKKIITVHSKDSWGAINSSGNWVIPYGKYTWIDGYDKGFVRARIGTITNGQIENDAKWSLITDGGFTVYSDCYDILPFYKRGNDYTEILKERNGLWEKVYFENAIDFLKGLAKPKPDYDPYDNRKWLHRYDGSNSDAFEDELGATWGRID